MLDAISQAEAVCVAARQSVCELVRYHGVADALRLLLSLRGGICLQANERILSHCFV